MHIALITEDRYEVPDISNPYEQQILEDDQALMAELEACGISAVRVSWSNSNIDWKSYDLAVFRTPWDYFHRYQEFSAWLAATAKKLPIVNPPETISWNINKRYLFELEELGVAIPEGKFLEAGMECALERMVKEAGWDTVILKPAVSGAARETYKFAQSQVSNYEERFQKLVAKEDMLIQAFQHPVLEKGEYSLMYFGGRYSHAVLKKAKPGDFRVQDDFGGSFEKVNPPQDMKTFADLVLQKTPCQHTYARVDVMWNNAGFPCLAELELIEPELWLRLHPEAAKNFAHGIQKTIQRLAINS